MRWLLAVLVWTGCPAPETDSDTDPVVPTDDTDIVTRETGPQVYARRCSSCHGATADGTSAGYELRHPPRPYATWVIRAGRPGTEFPRSDMPSWGDRQLDDEQLLELFDWLDAFEQPTTGAGLYRDYCGNCHGSDAAGGVVNRDLRGLDAERIAENVRNGNGDDDYGVRRAYMPAFVEDRLSDEEVTAIADFLRALKR